MKQPLLWLQEYNSLFSIQIDDFNRLEPKNGSKFPINFIKDRNLMIDLLNSEKTCLLHDEILYLQQTYLKLPQIISMHCSNKNTTSPAILIGTQTSNIYKLDLKWWPGAPGVARGGRPSERARGWPGGSSFRRC